MIMRMNRSLAIFAAFVTSWTLISAHTVITYPGWRGDTLHTLNATPGDAAYGQQWMYPCGGIGLTTNRTKWPVHGGAIALQPGWFSGHATAFFYINMGFQTEGPGTPPLNMSNPMVPVFQITGPSKNPYPGSFCLPQVPLPANASFNIGDNATIQVVETAIHGAALYNCVDITFADPSEVEPVTPQNCFNSSDIGFNQVYSTAASSDAMSTRRSLSSNLWILTPLLVSLVVAGVS
ncbi:MAG: hypothetical protein M1838_004500 [Thelocarpon superellum]|nr:MAG: hypothetical protein M1838_004500 [Thelocarpon superellum]